MRFLRGDGQVVLDETVASTDMAMKDEVEKREARNEGHGGKEGGAVGEVAPRKSIGNLFSGATRVLIVGVVVCLLGSAYWWQSMNVWCDILQENPEIYRSSGSYASKVKYLNSLYCAFSQHPSVFSNFDSQRAAAGVSVESTTTRNCNSSEEHAKTRIFFPDRGFWMVNTSDDAPNVASWTSQWEHRNLSWSLVEKEMVQLHGNITSKDLKLADTRSPVYDGYGCGKARPGPVILHIQRKGVVYGTIECPVYWHCEKPETAPRTAAVCWDSKFYDPPYPATLPTEMGPQFSTPKFGDKAVDMNYEFRGGIAFMPSVYSNWQSQIFDDKLLFLKGGCAETAPNLYFENETVLTRHEIIINLSHSLAYNQYHGLIELFSRWVIMLPIIKALPTVPILVTTRDAPHIAEMLQFAGINMYDLNVKYISRYDPRHPQKKPEAVYADMMIIPHQPVCSTTSGAVWDYIRQQIFGITYTGETPLEKDDSWYLVLSERTKTRGIVEHEALLAGLVSLLGKDKVKVFSDTVKWTKQEQLEFFRNAAIYMAPHGAGLANMVFMPFRSSVIEVRPLGWSNRCYHYVADMMRFSYYRFDSPGVKPSNLTVDVDQVLSLVSAIVQAKGHYVPFYEKLTTAIVKKN